MFVLTLKPYKLLMQIIFTFSLKRWIFIILLSIIFIIFLVTFNLLLNLKIFFQTKEISLLTITMPFGIMNFGPLIISFLVSNLVFDYLYNQSYCRLFIVTSNSKRVFFNLLNYVFAIIGFLFFLLQWLISFFWHYNDYLTFGKLINWTKIIFSGIFAVILGNQIAFFTSIIKNKKWKNFLVFVLFLLSIPFSGILLPYQFLLFTNLKNQNLNNLIGFTLFFPFTYSALLLTNAFLGFDHAIIFNSGIFHFQILVWTVPIILIVILAITNNFINFIGLFNHEKNTRNKKFI